MTNMKGRPCGDPHVGAGEAAPTNKLSGARDLTVLRGIPLADCFRACALGELQGAAGMTRPLQAFGDQVRALHAAHATARFLMKETAR